MNKKLLSRFLAIPAFAFLLVSCVAEKDFDNSAFETVPPENLSSAPADDPVPAADVYRAKFETSQGDFVIEVHPEWAPRGAAQFRKLIEEGVFNEARFFRVVPGFMVQFGIPGDPKVSAKWRNNTIPDDPVIESNTRGMVSFATSGPNSRTSQVFITYGNHGKEGAQLDSQGFSPFGKVIEGMDIVDSINAEYGETPDQGQIQQQGNTYLNEKFPKLDFIKKATILPEEVETAESADSAEKTSE